jgi:hypothetical protein
MCEAHLILIHLKAHFDDIRYEAAIIDDQNLGWHGDILWS